MAETTLDLRSIPEIELERDDFGNVRVAIEGRVDDDEVVDEVLKAGRINPVSITVETESEEEP